MKLHSTTTPEENETIHYFKKLVSAEDEFLPHESPRRPCAEILAIIDRLDAKCEEWCQCAADMDKLGANKLIGEGLLRSSLRERFQSTNSKY